AEVILFRHVSFLTEVGSTPQELYHWRASRASNHGTQVRTSIPLCWMHSVVCFLASAVFLLSTDGWLLSISLRRSIPMFYTASALLIGTSCLLASNQPDTVPPKLTDAVVQSADGVRIAYTAGGKGEPALLFIHGGLADRSFWAAQLEPLAARH